jgi:hypothetical protein
MHRHERMTCACNLFTRAGLTTKFCLAAPSTCKRVDVKLVKYALCEPTCTIGSWGMQCIVLNLWHRPARRGAEGAGVPRQAAEAAADAPAGGPGGAGDHQGQARGCRWCSCHSCWGCQTMSRVNWQPLQCVQLESAQVPGAYKMSLLLKELCGGALDLQAIEGMLPRI